MRIYCIFDFCDKNKIAPDPTSDDQTCDERNGVIGYVLSDSEMTWDDSQQYCLDVYGTNLITIYDSIQNIEATKICEVCGVNKFVIFFFFHFCVKLSWK